MYSNGQIIGSLYKEYDLTGSIPEDYTPNIGEFDEDDFKDLDRGYFTLTLDITPVVAKTVKVNKKTQNLN